MKRKIVIDADHILFLILESKKFKNADLDEIDGFDDTNNDLLIEVEEVDLKPLKRRFKEIIQYYVSTAELEIALNGDKVGKTMVVMSDSKNFRYDIYPEYKANRPSSDKVMSDMRAWARKKYICEPNTEADDVVAYYVRKGAIGVTTDKDLLYGVEGLWFNSHYKHQNWVRTTKEEAEYFFKQQVLAGDSVDNIPSIKGMGLITADKAMRKNGTSWEDILNIFKSKGYDKDYMVTMARLVSMSQWSPKKGIELWEIPN
jgi:hypothetical protein